MVSGSRAGRGSGRLLTAALLLYGGQALAQPTDVDRTLATELFKQGRTLMAEGKYTEACPKLAESQRLDPGGGTLLNLALCHEAEGRTATAWAELNEAAAIAQRDGRADRLKLAEEHAAALEPKLSRLVVTVPVESDVAGLTIHRDGSPVPRVAWGTAIPVDPGEHQLEATAVDRQSWSTSVTVVGEGSVETVTIPLLEPLPVVELPPPIVPPAAQPAAPIAPAASFGPPPPPSPRADEIPPNVTPYYATSIAAGVGGAVAMGLSLGFYVDADSKLSDSDAACVGGCTDEGSQLSHDAVASADVATGMFIAGVVSFGISGAMLVLGLSSDADAPVSAQASRATIRF